MVVVSVVVVVLVVVEVVGEFVTTFPPNGSSILSSVTLIESKFLV